MIPDTNADLLEFFLDTDAREIEIKIGRLNQDFFGHISCEIAQIKFVVTRTAVSSLHCISRIKINGLNSTKIHFFCK